MKGGEFHWYEIKNDYQWYSIYKISAWKQKIVYKKIKKDEFLLITYIREKSTDKLVSNVLYSIRSADYERKMNRKGNNWIPRK